MQGQFAKCLLLSLFSSSGLFQIIKPPLARATTSCPTSPLLQELPQYGLPHQYYKSSHIMPYLTSTVRAPTSCQYCKSSHIMPYLTSTTRAPTSCPTSPVLQELPHRALPHQYCKSSHIVPYLTSTARAPTSCPTSPVLQELPHRALPHQYCKSSHIVPYLTSTVRAPTSCQYCKSSHIVPYLTSTTRAPTSCPTSPVLQELPHRALPHQYCKSSHIVEGLPGCDQRNSASVMQRTTVFMNLRTSMFVFVLKTNKC